MQVEMLFAMDDGSWFSDVRSIPDDAIHADYASGQWDAEVIAWIETHACPRDCVLVAVYNSDPDCHRTAEDLTFAMAMIPDDDPDTSYLDQEGFEERREEYRNGYFDFVGVRATTVIDGVEYTSGGLWGIESDSSDEYFQEVFEEEKAQLIAELIKTGIIEAEEEKAA